MAIYTFQMSPNISLPDLGTLENWRRNFLSLNEQKLTSAREQLSVRQQAVLNVLPVLLHANSTRMPGYVAPDTPCGITGYSPGLAEHSALHQFARGVQLPRDPGQRCIHGVYLMGSLGSVAQSKNSDLDVWVCHDELLTDYQLEALQEKCRRIEKWADGQGTEVHFFLMNLKDFREGQSRSADGEDCGSSQHLLLLDEFYRSALWLAGKTPRWWLIPTEYESRADSYWSALIDNHLVDIEQWLDVGALPTIPAGEFVGAGLWQISKSLGSPYKSLLKLLLNCEYASRYPNIKPLAWDLKEAVHSDNATPANTDPYLMMLNRLESHLGKEDNEDRDLMRRSFYFKTGIALTQLSANQRNQWRTKALLEQVNSWEWDNTYLAQLDSRQQWPALKVLKERNALVTRMLGAYRTLVSFSEQHADSVHINQQDMTVLGNRLYAAFRTEPGKITDINPGIRGDMEEEKLTLNLKNDIWQLIPGTWRPGDDSAVLTQSPSLMEILFYARRNGLLTSHSHVALYPSHNPVTQYELRAILQDVLAIPMPRKSKLNFKQDSHAVHWHLFINPGVNPQQSLSRRGMQKISNRDDALGFSSRRENLVQTVELLSINSWGEWQVDYFSGNDAIHDAVLKVLNFRRYLDHNGWPKWEVHCHCQVRSVGITRRIEQLLEDLIEHISKAQPAPYLLQTGDSFHLIEYRRKEVISHHAPNLNELVRLLARPRRRFRRWELDRHALPASPLRLVLQQAEGDEWHVWYWRQKERVYVYVTDENGSLHYEQIDGTDIRQQLVPVLRFVHHLNQRWATEQNQEARPLLLSELILDPESFTFSAVARRIPNEATGQPSPQLTAFSNSGEPLELSLNGTTYSQATHGRALIPQLREDSGQPVLKLDDLTIVENTHLTRHLDMKRRLEKLLNATNANPRTPPREAQTSS
ncbi:MAG: class I adenylate cyclase [Thalassolituus sp.]